MPFRRNARRKTSRKVYRKRALRPVRRRFIPPPETKHIEISLSSVFGAVGTTPIVWEFTNLAVGTSAQTRIGNRVSFRGISFKGVWQGSDAHNVMRYAILKVNDSWTVSDFTIDQWDSILEGKNVMKVLLDRYVVQQNSLYTDNTAISENKFLTGYRKLFGYQRYDGSATAPPTYGRYVLVMVSDSALATHPGFINGYAKATYIDA